MVGLKLLSGDFALCDSLGRFSVTFCPVGFTGRRECVFNVKGIPISCHVNLFPHWNNSPLFPVLVLP